MAGSIVHPWHMHPLVKFLGEDEYVCKSCATSGSGERYRCHPCNFDVHVFCATCPPVLTSCDTHPEHSLQVLMRMAEQCRAPAQQRACHVCGDEVQGLFYWCRICDLSVHPLCTQWPPLLHHGSHPHHLSHLASDPKYSCSICGYPCGRWAYRCPPCGVHLHHGCAVKPFGMTPPPPLSPAAKYTASAPTVVGVGVGVGVDAGAYHGTATHQMYTPHYPDQSDPSAYNFGPRGVKGANNKLGFFQRVKMAAKVLWGGVPGAYS